MIRKHIALVLAAALCITASGCKQEAKAQKYSYQFFGTFDTVIQLVGYTNNQDTFDTYAQYTRQRFEELHQLFDRYYEYAGVNNIKTINDHAGKEPVKVDDTLIDLLQFGLDWYNRTDGAVNIAMGSLLSLWQGAIDQYQHDSTNATLPNHTDLIVAGHHMDIGNVKIDAEAKTVYLADPDMLLDVGAIAKGYATEIVAKELEAKGFTSFIISAGGNVRASGKPMDERAHWGIGIQDPNGNPLNPAEEPVDTVFINNMSVVSSGDYQRYYMVQSVRMHHIIDGKTLMPGQLYHQVSVILPDSGQADALSTALFLMDLESGRQLAAQMGAGVMWYCADGSIQINDIYKAYSKVYGGQTAMSPVSPPAVQSI